MWWTVEGVDQGVVFFFTREQGDPDKIQDTLLFFCFSPTFTFLIFVLILVFGTVCSLTRS